jgi:putative membrane protein insertion efficiency factor
MTKLIGQGLIRLIKLYQLAISPWFGAACRFEPSCSRYMQGAIVTHGLLRGVALGVGRLARCHPWGGSGYDPVPTPLHLAHGHSHPMHVHSHAMQAHSHDASRG